MIDWLVSSDATGTFVEADDDVLTYEDLAAVRSPRDGTVSEIVPVPDAGSVRELYRAFQSGPVVVGGGGGRGGSALGSSVMTLMFTSGTTGSAKPVPLSTANWHAAVEASANHLGHTGDDTWLVAMPLHHVGGLSVLLRSSFVGARVVLQSSFDPGRFAEGLGRVTMASVVPTMLRRVLDHDDRHFAGLKAVLVGGGPLPSGILEEAHRRGIPALPTYGMTETCAQVATLRPGSPPEYRADLLPGIEARVTEEGRVALRGPQVFSGYLNGSGVDAEGWFVTGDFGEVDGGALRIEGRADDVIVSGGENVDPSVVEGAVSAHPAVTGVLVVGVPSDEWGSEVVCLYTGPASIDELREWGRERLEPFQVPKRWISVETIPLTPVGKPDRIAGRGIALGQG